jgi:nuclear transport factor 2 (NTF2) superfamily protein
MASNHEELLRGAYAAFNARDIERALVLMHSEVDWPNGMEGGRVRGHDEVREYWTRQFGLIDSHVEPVGFETLDDGRVAVKVHQVVRDTSGALVSDSHVRHVYSFAGGLVARMEIDTQAA